MEEEDRKDAEVAYTRNIKKFKAKLDNSKYADETVQA